MTNKAQDWEKTLLTDEQIDKITRVSEDSGVPINKDALYGITLADLRELRQVQASKTAQYLQAEMERLTFELNRALAVNQLNQEIIANQHEE